MKNLIRIQSRKVVAKKPAKDTLNVAKEEVPEKKIAIEI